MLKFRSGNAIMRVNEADLESGHRLVRREVYSLIVPYLALGEQVCGTYTLDEHLDYNLLLGSEEANQAMVESMIMINSLLYKIRPKLRVMSGIKLSMEKKFPHLIELEKSELEASIRAEMQK
ncbi:MAG: hypothetical protein AABW84_00090 [Nanoarchaeota archaeon]